MTGFCAIGIIARGRTRDIDATLYYIPKYGRKQSCQYLLKPDIYSGMRTTNCKQIYLFQKALQLACMATLTGSS